jgi:phytoene desaturase
MTKRIAIVGAGVGGLATAARLSCLGHEVEVFEKLPECGGRAHIIEDRGFTFDTGPSFVLMPDFFEELFSSCGKKIGDFLDLQELETHYKIFYSDGSTFTVFRDADRTREELERLEPGSAKSYDAFIKDTEAVYRDVKPLLYKCFTKKSIANPRYWRLLLTLKPQQSYWQKARKFFKSDKLGYAFTFEAMFIGVSPFDSPGFYSIITYADHVQKIFHPMGGMYQIPVAFEKMAREFGARFAYSTEVRGIKPVKGSVQISTAEGKTSADAVVVNADYAYAQESLLRRQLPTYRYSCSVYLIYLGLRQKITGLEHHNLFLAHDVRKNLQQIFDHKPVADDLSFYIHIPTLTDQSLAPAGKDLVYILVPVANLQHDQEAFDGAEEKIRNTVFSRVLRETGIDLPALAEVEHRFYPRDFITRYNLQYGATFGLSHTLLQSAFFRPSNADAAAKNLFYVGASTQPGGGLPPVIASSKIVADLIHTRP